MADADAPSLAERKHETLDELFGRMAPESSKWHRAIASAADRKEIGPHWPTIASEVRARKTLIMAAQADLHGQLHLPADDALLLAATDVFVEKAQLRLTKRAHLFAWCGVLCAAAAVAISLGIARVVYSTHVGALFPKESTNPYLLTVLVMKSLTAGGFAGGTVYFLGALARAFFHESNGLLSRRHALRFGRLYVYLRRGRLEFRELEEAFKWSAEFTSAFKDIRAERLGRSAFHQVNELLATQAELLKGIGAALQTPGSRSVGTEQPSPRSASGP